MNSTVSDIEETPVIILEIPPETTDFPLPPVDLDPGRVTPEWNLRIEEVLKVKENPKTSQWNKFSKR